MSVRLCTSVRITFHHQEMLRAKPTYCAPDSDVDSEEDEFPVNVAKRINNVAVRVDVWDATIRKVKRQAQVCFG